MKPGRRAVFRWPPRLTIVVTVAVLGLLAYAVVSLSGGGGTPVVARVIDGDTVELENGDVVRYLGIDTPETVHPDKPVECYGPEATEANRRLVEGQKVRLERDVTDTDTFGRLLRYVYVDETFVQAELVHEGYAYVYSRQPDVKYLKELAALERKAREEGLGLWGACTLEGGAP